MGLIISFMQGWELTVRRRCDAPPTHPHPQQLPFAQTIKGRDRRFTCTIGPLSVNELVSWQINILHAK